jgi:hypothetical protein
MKNRGVLLGSKSTDWIAGATSKIPYEVRNPSGDWTPYLVRGEKQWFKNMDSMGCVSFAVNNVTEIQYKQQTGIELNKSDRFLAKLSGTTHKGNWVYIVLDTARYDGVVDEEEWPTPPEPFSWDDYYTAIPKFVYDRAAKQSKDKYDLHYEKITDHSAESINYHLKHAPLLITIPGHEVTGVVLSADNKELTYFDSYEPWIKKTKLTNIEIIYKAVITAKGSKMIGYKKVGDPTTYVQTEGRMIPVADWVAFTAMGGSTASVVELSEEQFNKFIVINSVLFKSK